MGWTAYDGTEAISRANRLRATNWRTWRYAADLRALVLSGNRRPSGMPAIWLILTDVRSISTPTSLGRARFSLVADSDGQMDVRMLCGGGEHHVACGGIRLVIPSAEGE